ncbi:hypothetical protein AOQ88_00610 [Candidatus Riesia sp. GBBU]|nr:hypothetical protein AOQ88_00610 [Candidatus Riesia sp. GBBU]
MKKIILIHIFFSLIFQTNQVFSNASKELKNRLDKIDNLYSEFIQKTINERKEIIENKGELWIKKPNLFHFYIRYPEEYRVISDGKNIWIYDASVNQVTIRYLKDFYNIPMLFIYVRNFAKFFGYSVDQKDDDFTLSKKYGKKNLLFLININKEGKIKKFSIEENKKQKILYCLKSQKIKPLISIENFKFIPKNNVLVDDQRRK